MKRLSDSVGIRLRKLNREKVEEELVRACKLLSKSSPILTAILFGSLIRGNYSGCSDADVLLVVKNAPKDESERYRLFNRIKASAPVQLFVFTEKEITERILDGDTFIIEAIVTGKPLIGYKYYEKLLSMCEKAIKKYGLRRTKIGWVRIRD